MKASSHKTSQMLIQEKLNYQFKNSQLMTLALTHRSYGSQNNERLEFIGDSILDYVIAKMLYEAFPNLPEGTLSPLRAQLVKEATLAEIAQELSLGEALHLGRGEIKSGGTWRASILADALEALVAAISFDSDFQAAEKIVRQLFAKRIKQLDLKQSSKDAKTELQETLQAKKHPLPVYTIEKQYGEGSDAHFDVSCYLSAWNQFFYANAKNRRTAEQDCAKQALAWLKNKK